MEKSIKSDSENPVWLTELTDAEMEATAGGILTGATYSKWLKQYKAHTLNYRAVYIKLESEIAGPDQAVDQKNFNRWYGKLSASDKKLVLPLAKYVKNYFKIS